FPRAQYRDLRGRLVIPESHEHRLPEQTLVGPFLIPHLRHERRLDPGMTGVLWRGPGERGLGANSLLKRRAHVVELRRGEAAAHAARVHELAVPIGAQVQRAEPRARALGAGEAHAPEVLREAGAGLSAARR